MDALEHHRYELGSRGGRGRKEQLRRGSRSRSRSRTTSRWPRGRPCRTGPRSRRASATCSASGKEDGSARSGNCASSRRSCRSNCSRSCATPTKEVMLERARRTGAGIVYRTGSGPTRFLGRRSAGSKVVYASSVLGVLRSILLSGLARPRGKPASDSDSESYSEARYVARSRRRVPGAISGAQRLSRRSLWHGSNVVTRPRGGRVEGLLLRLLLVARARARAVLLLALVAGAAARAAARA